ncbi:galanin receptor type 1-like [Ciona intestinalis]
MVQISAAWQIVIPIVIGVVLFIGLVGNSLVIYVTVTTQRAIKHPVHSMLVLNLAAADLTYLIASAPYQAMSNSPISLGVDSFLCPSLHFISVLTMSVGIFTICALAWMRFMALIVPFRFQGSMMSTRTFGCIVLVVVWVISCVVSTPNLVYYRPRPDKSGPNQTDRLAGICEWTDVKAADDYAIALFVITYLVPFLLVANFYFFIGREVCYLVNRPRRVDIVGGKNEQKEYTKTTIMVLCLIIAFLLCWFPHHLYRMMKISGNYSTLYNNVDKWITMATIEQVGACMSYMHSCINPVIYTFAAPGFRRSLLESITGRRCNNHSEITDSCHARRNRRRRGAGHSNCAPRKSSHDAVQMLAITHHEPPTCVSRLPSPLLSVSPFPNSNLSAEKRSLTEQTNDQSGPNSVNPETRNGGRVDEVV